MLALVDCDSFFVSCERADNPNLRQRPVCVITGERGCVVSRSREAKAIGVKMGQPYFQAKKEFPQIDYISVHHEQYKKYSASVMQCLREFSPEVEVCSIDEAYMNLSGLEKLYNQTYHQIALRIRQTVWNKCQIPVSIGLSTSKTLAKLASDKAKNTGGIFVIDSGDIKKILETTEIEEICGLGKQNTGKLKMYGIFNGWEFTQNSDSWMRQHFGIKGLELKYELLGHIINKVNPTSARPKSIQDTAALLSFTNDASILRASLKHHVHNASHKLRQNDCFCKTIGVMLRTKDFAESVDYVKLPQATNSEREIYEAALKIFTNIYNPRIIYRSSGIILDNLQEKGEYQPQLFSEPEYNDDKISRVIDELEKKFGPNIIKNGLF